VFHRLSFRAFVVETPNQLIEQDSPLRGSPLIANVRRHDQIGDKVSDTWEITLFVFSPTVHLAPVLYVRRRTTHPREFDPVPVVVQTKYLFFAISDRAGLYVACSHGSFSFLLRRD
jgi:hypothetical protein